MRVHAQTLHVGFHCLVVRVFSWSPCVFVYLSHLLTPLLLSFWSQFWHWLSSCFIMYLCVLQTSC